jgi:hypothetical protein
LGYFLFLQEQIKGIIIFDSPGGKREEPGKTGRHPVFNS